ncbi:MAG: hypothetical protein GW809_07025 [Bacteroidetes bacterium]|nr:hypothetical protein [Bacteroidota bacterium]
MCEKIVPTLGVGCTFTTKPSGQGTGLGLSMSYDINKNSHQGELNVETLEGSGTTFTIKLPRTT